MKWESANLRTCLYFIAAITLLAGIGSAGFIYKTSLDRLRSAQAYGDGSVYPVSPEDSKQYLRGLQLYGGTANVLADELRRWFAGLWRGKSLAFTVAFISILISSAIFYAAKRLRLKANTRNNGVRVRRRTED